MSLIVTGSIGIDTVESPTGSAANVLGGSCVYFAAAASYFGPVRLVGAVGDDFPEEFYETFDHFNIDRAGLEVRKGSKTFRWSGRYHENLNDRDTVEVELNVLGEAMPPVPENYRDSRFVFLANTHPAAQTELLEQFPSRKLAVADTMDLWIKTEHQALEDLMKKLDGLVLNDSEAQLLTGKSNLVQAAEEIVKMGPAFVVVKKGEHGALLIHKDGKAVLPAYPAASVSDPTGAGDSFAGGMMGHLAAADSVDVAHIRRAMAVGTVVASYNIEDFSLQRMRKIGRPEIEGRLAEYASMVNIAG